MKSQRAQSARPPTDRAVGPRENRAEMRGDRTAYPRMFVQDLQLIGDFGYFVRFPFAYQARLSRKGFECARALLTEG